MYQFLFVLFDWVKKMLKKMTEQQEDYDEIESEECDDLTGGRLKYCCIPFCKNAFYTRDSIQIQAYNSLSFQMTTESQDG